MAWMQSDISSDSALSGVKRDIKNAFLVNGFQQESASSLNSQMSFPLARDHKTRLFIPNFLALIPAPC